MTEIKAKDNGTNITASRIPVHQQRAYNYSGLGLDFKKYKYHWANASSTMGSNIERYVKAGYQQVMDSKGQPIRRNIGRHDEGHQYMMCIPIELYNQDTAKKLLIPTQIEADMGKGQLSNSILGQHSYVPPSGIRIKAEVGK